MQTSGFTLLELLVTLAITGILSSISIANYMTFRDAAYGAEMTFAMHDMWTAAKAVEQELADAVSEKVGLNIGSHDVKIDSSTGTPSETTSTQAPNLSLRDFIEAYYDHERIISIVHVNHLTTNVGFNNSQFSSVILRHCIKSDNNVISRSESNNSGAVDVGPTTTTTACP